VMVGVVKARERIVHTYNSNPSRHAPVSRPELREGAGLCMG